MNLTSGAHNTYTVFSFFFYHTVIVPHLCDQKSSRLIDASDSKSHSPQRLAASTQTSVCSFSYLCHYFHQRSKQFLNTYELQTTMSLTDVFFFFLVPGAELN